MEAAGFFCLECNIYCSIGMSCAKPRKIPGNMPSHIVSLSTIFPAFNVLLYK